MASVSTSGRHQGDSDWLRSARMAKKAAGFRPEDNAKAASGPKRNGGKGTIPAARKASSSSSALVPA